MKFIIQSFILDLPTVMIVAEFIFCIVTCTWCNINSIDTVLGDYGNHDINSAWYDDIDILSVPI